MKILTSLTAVASILGVSIAAPMSSPVENVLEKRIDQCRGHLHLIDFDTKAAGGGYDRWFFKYAGFDCTDFRDALDNKAVLKGPLSSRTDCDNPAVADEYHVTTWKGDPSVKAVLSAIKSITGQPCDDFALPKWAQDLCDAMMKDQYHDSGCLKNQT